MLTEPLVELVMQSVGTFQGLTLVDAAKGDIFDSEEKVDDIKEDDTNWDTLKTFLLDTLGKDKIGKVQLSKRLTDSPAVLVQGDYGVSPMMKKYIQANAAALGGDQCRSHCF